MRRRYTSVIIAACMPPKQFGLPDAAAGQPRSIAPLALEIHEGFGGP